MGDLVIFFVWIVGLVLAVIVIVAQFQLFAIRRLLEVLVKQPGGSVAAAGYVREVHEGEVFGPDCTVCGAALHVGQKKCLSCGNDAPAGAAAPPTRTGADAGLPDAPASVAIEAAAPIRGAERVLASR